jgi:brefeldin A-resistance guanine nucleotide exchange factor 1
MNAANILVPPSPDDQRDEQQITLWSATHERIERFLPGFLAEVVSVPLRPSPPNPSQLGTP